MKMGLHPQAPNSEVYTVIEILNKILQECKEDDCFYTFIEL